MRWLMRFTIPGDDRTFEQYFKTKRAALDCVKRDGLTVISLTRVPL